MLSCGTVMNLAATHYNCTSPMDYISHHALHTHIPVHHYTNHTAVTIHSLVLIVSPHLHLIHSHTFKQHSHMHSLRSLVWLCNHFWAFLPCLIPRVWPGPFTGVFAASPDHKPELWLWFCLAYVVFEASVWILPVWPPLCINKAAIVSNYTASALQVHFFFADFFLNEFNIQNSIKINK